VSTPRVHLRSVFALTEPLCGHQEAAETLTHRLEEVTCPECFPPPETLGDCIMRALLLAHQDWCQPPQEDTP